MKLQMSATRVIDSGQEDVRPTVWPSERPNAPTGSEPPPGPGDEGQEAGIVIAIGDVDFGQVVYDALCTASPRVVLVASATLALHELDGLRPALLVVDDELPLVRGLDLAGRVRSERSDADIILLTDDDLVVELVGRLRVERVRCLQKPVDLERLRQAVALSLRGLAARRGGSSYDDLLAELEDQRSRFERRIKNLERRQASSRPPPSVAEPAGAPPTLAPPTMPAVAPETPSVTPLSFAPATIRESEAPSNLPEDLRVLVVDDDPLVRRAIARRFKKQQVTLAENGLAATRALEHERPDVIVSDLKMPEMDGLALAEEVKRRWPELAERIVFVSGAGSQIQRAEQAAPAQRVLRKPVEGRQLENRIVEVLEKALLPRKP
jgi:DNA-binding response OmpR family regulator